MDGLLVAGDSTIAASGTLANTNGFYVGIDRDGTSNGWDGYIDEVRVIKGRALTVEEIKAAASRRYSYAVYTSPVVDASVLASGGIPSIGLKAGSTPATGNSHTTPARLLPSGILTTLPARP